MRENTQQSNLQTWAQSESNAVNLMSSSPSYETCMDGACGLDQKVPFAVGRSMQGPRIEWRGAMVGDVVLVSMSEGCSEAGPGVPPMPDTRLTGL